MLRSITVLILLLQTLAFAGEPIQLHPENPHYFLYQGMPTVLVTSGEHYGAVLNLDFDYDVYLKTLAKDGLNLTRVFTGTYVEKQGAFGIENNTLAPADGRFLPPWVRSSEPGYAGGGNKFDLDRWNPDYFERLKDFMRSAEKNGVVVELVFTSATYTELGWSWNPFNPSNNVNGIQFTDWRQINTKKNGKILKYQERLVKKLVIELNEFDNLYYEIQNEPWADTPDSVGVLLDNITPDDMKTRGGIWENRVDLAQKAALDWHKHIAKLVKKTEETLPKKHLLAQNYSNHGWPLPEVDKNIDVINFHYNRPESVTWNWGWDRPIGYDESGFVGQKADDYRKLVWRFMLSGGAVFNGLDYSFYPGKEDGTGKNSAPGVCDPEFRVQLGFLKSILDRLDFVHMQPDKQTVLHAPGARVWMLSKPGNTWAAFLEGHDASMVKVQIPEGRYSLVWYCPKSGKNVKNDRVLHMGGASELHLPTGFESGELVFILQKI